MVSRVQRVGPILFLAIVLSVAGHLAGIVLWSTILGLSGVELPPSIVLSLLTVLLVLLAVACFFLAVVALHLSRMTTERTRLYEAEREARASAEAAIHTRDEFLSAAAHELRNPLTSLYGFSDYLNQARAHGTIDADRLQRGLTIINRQANKLSRLIDALLEVSRLEMNRLSLRCEQADLVPIVDEVVEAMRAQSPDRPILVTYPAAAPTLIDVPRVQEVVRNLVENAIKFSPAGSPIDVEIANLADGQVEVAVRDYGVGVDDTHRDLIFQRFYRAQGGNQSSGLGVGLYISREILLLHGGELLAEFPEDGGSRFLLRLPTCSDVAEPRLPLDRAG